ncbi:MAG: putative peptidoglycan lipid flippase [Actinomycetota bacterium]|nr:putative peptidoglycan lipid flippase [Actinomycetota bacterium]MDQ1498205.1 putative peptidoglycan lipid flippase [Actinomycetota bacterium]
MSVAAHTEAAGPPTAVGRAARVMGAATAVSRILGFGRVLVIAAVLGTTDLGNTFSASNSVSNVLFDLLAAGALSAVLVPAFVELLDRPSRADAEAERLAGALLGWSLVVLGPICLAGVLAAPALARLLTTGTADPVVAAGQRHLATFLLRLFVPQVLLYAVGAITTAVLHARRHFTVTAVAPIGNTVMMVLALGTFRALHGRGAAGFDLSLAERLSLGAAGTLGVAAFVAIPAVALRRTGFRLRLRVPRPGAVPGLGRAVRLSGWAGLQHAGTAVLLAAALLVGMGVSGGVVAYQVAFACFLVPYAVLALPLITAVLPELAGEAGRGDLGAFGRSLRWALDGMVGFVVPVGVAGVVFAPRVMGALAFGQTSEGGGRLIGFGLAALAAGLLPYGAFLLFVRAHYALGEGRAPAAAALGSAGLGAALMAAGGALAHGDAKLAVMGAAHSIAYLVGAVVLGVGLARRTGQPLAPARLPRALALSIALGAACAAVLDWVDPAGRTATLGLVLVLAAVSAAIYLGALGPTGAPATSAVRAYRPR